MNLKLCVIFLLRVLTISLTEPKKIFGIKNGIGEIKWKEIHCLYFCNDESLS